MIFVDSREPSRIIEKLRELGLNTVIRRLEIGDYLIKHGTYEVIIERKSAEDFLSSIVDNRLFRQCHILSSRYPFSFLFVVGNLRKAAEERNFNVHGIVGALISLAVKNVQGQVVPLVFETEDEFCYAVKSVEKRLVEGELRIVPRLQKLESPQIAMLQAIPGIGEKKALNLLRKFGNVYRIVNASVSELARVEGIGEKKAREIYRTFRREFK